MYIQQLTLATIIFVEKPLLKFKPMSCHSPVQSNLLPVQDVMILCKILNASVYLVLVMALIELDYGMRFNLRGWLFN